MEFVMGQLVVILAPYIDQEIYANIRHVLPDKLSLVVKTAGNLVKNREILCLIIDGTEMFEFYSRIEEVSGSTIYITKPQKNGLSVIEKRKFNRIDCSIGFVGMPMILGDVPIISTDKKFTGLIKNISAGGIMTETAAYLQKDMVFTFKLKLNYFIDCTAIVRRTIESASGIGYECGCEFVNMTLENVKTISLYTFREQLKKRRQELAPGGNMK